MIPFVVALAGCVPDIDTSRDEGDADTDSDVDADTDADSDSDTDADSDADSDADTAPPEDFSWWDGPYAGWDGDVVLDDVAVRYDGLSEYYNLGSDLAVGDLDDDGTNDLAIVAPSDDTNPSERHGTVYVAYGPVNGTGDVSRLADRVDLVVPPAGFAAAVAAPGDVDGDGIDDLAVAWGDQDRSEFGVFAGPISGAIGASVAIGRWSGTSDQVIPTNTVAIGIGDIDGDTHPDVAFSDDRSTIYVVTAPGTGTFSSLPHTINHTWGREFTAGDTNADGISDLVLPYEFGVVVCRGPIGSLIDVVACERQATLPRSTPGMVVGDVDGDGYGDLSLASEGGYQETPEGPWVGWLAVYDGAVQTEDDHDYLAAVMGSDQRRFESMLTKAGDADGDGTTDLVGAFRPGASNAFVLRNPRGLLTIDDAVEAGDVTTFDGSDRIVRAIATGDLTGDGVGDLAISTEAPPHGIGSGSVYVVPGVWP